MQLKLNEGQLNNIKGLVGEKIVSMKKDEISDFILDRLGRSWKFMSIGRIENWFPPLSPILVYGTDKKIEYSTSENPSNVLTDIRSVFKSDQIFLINDIKILEKFHSAEKWWADEEKLKQHIGYDWSFVVYKLAGKKKKIKRSFVIRPLHHGKVARKEFSRAVQIIEDVKIVLVEIKSMKKVRLTDAQKEKGSNDTFSFIAKLVFDLDISKTIRLNITKKF